MKIMDLLNKETILFGLKAKDKDSAITEMTDALVKLHKLKSSSEVIELLLQREKLGSTGIGQGVAIPHCRCDMVKEPMALLAISKEGLDFNSLDSSPVHIIFMLVGSADSAGEHLQIMAKISRILKDKIMRQSLMDTKTAEDVIAIIQKADA